ncbi:MAG: ATP-dependent helicase, partial [Halobacteriaceae archaeon]
ADHVFLATDLTEKVVEQMSATADADFDSDAVPLVTDNERRVFYVGMSRARERLVLLENLVSGAPTLPLDVLLFGAADEGDLEEFVELKDAVTV